MFGITIITLPPDSDEKKRRRKAVRFTLKYSKRARPQNRPLALGAFTDGAILHVIYKIQAGSKIYEENQLRTCKEQIVIGNRIPAHERLPRAEWETFLELPYGTKFRFGERETIWTKVTHQMLSERLGNQIVHVSSAPAVSTEAPIRRTVKNREVTVLLCQPANFDHSNGEAAVSVTVECKGEIEPLIMSAAEAQRLVAGVLICLWTHDDEFAGEVLEKHFPTRNGQYVWPRTE